MKTSFWLGLTLGLVSGMCVATGNTKARELINQSKQKLDDIKDNM